MTRISQFQTVNGPIPSIIGESSLGYWTANHHRNYPIDMALNISDIRRMFVSNSVGVVFAFLIMFLVLIEFGMLEWLGDPFIGLLSPGWGPVYVAMLYASGLRNNFFPWLGGGPSILLVTAFFLYVEAVLFAGVYRSVRGIYHRYNRGKLDERPS